MGLKRMVGCAVCTSLGIAPALLLAGDALIVDLDGPLLLLRDREPSLTYRDELDRARRCTALGVAGMA